MSLFCPLWTTAELNVKSREQLFFPIFFIICIQQFPFQAKFCFSFLQARTLIWMDAFNSLTQTQVSPWPTSKLMHLGILQYMCYNRLCSLHTQVPPLKQVRLKTPALSWVFTHLGDTFETGHNTWPSVLFRVFASH